MHVSAVNPLNTFLAKMFLQKHWITNVSSNWRNKERRQARKLIIPKIVEGRVNKFLSEINLNDKHSSKTQTKLLHNSLHPKNGSVKGFVRFTVGERYREKENNFVDEVMGQIK